MPPAARKGVARIPTTVLATATTPVGPVTQTVQGVVLEAADISDDWTPIGIAPAGSGAMPSSSGGGLPSPEQTQRSLQSPSPPPARTSPAWASAKLTSWPATFAAMHSANGDLQRGSPQHDRPAMNTYIVSPSRVLRSPTVAAMSQRSLVIGSSRTDLPTSKRMQRIDPEIMHLLFNEALGIECQVTGEGLHMGKCRQVAIFTIATKDKSGETRVIDANSFVVAIRGASRVRAKILPDENVPGTFHVEYKPSVSGTYSISISLFGIGVPGSPFSASVITPSPVASQCKVSGNSLTHAVARVTQTFEVRFRDQLGEVAHAEELDVYLERLGADGEPFASSPPHRLGDDPWSYAASSPPSPPGSPTSARRRAALNTRVEVGSKPLIVRARVDLRSEQIGQLQVGQSISILDERTLPDGSVRSLVGRCEENAGAYAISESWSKSEINVEEELASIIVEQNPSLQHRLLPGVLSALIEGRAPSPEAMLQDLSSVPEGDEFWEDVPQEPKSSARSNVTWASEAPVSPIRRPASASVRVGLSTGSSPLQASPPSQRGRSVPSARSMLEPPLHSHRSRSGDVSSRKPKPTMPSRKASAVIGWVTTAKAGNMLVIRKERLDATERLLHKEQWARRLRSDKTVSATSTRAIPRSNSFTPNAPREMRRTVSDSAGKTSVFKQELLSDPTGIAFAFGGVDPGTLRAHGKLHPVHRVSYSVGRVGKFLLHVALRNQATPLPGSPWTLHVSPGVAHAGSTIMDVASGPWRGPVGTASECGVSIHVHGFDKMGNQCVQGGAPLKPSCKSSIHVECTCEDQNDGSYIITFRSRYSGDYVCEALIDGAHVIGSPTHILLTSTHPKIDSTVLAGEGLTKARVGEQAIVVIKLFDEYSNHVVPDEDLDIGLALEPSTWDGDVDSLVSMDFEGAWSNRDEGEYTLNYEALRAGKMHLYIWCTLEGEQQLFPGSPFKLVVVAGEVDFQKSSIETVFNGTGYTMLIERSMQIKDSAPEKVILPYKQGNKITAGDVVIFRPSLVDRHHNVANLDSAKLDVQLFGPDNEPDTNNIRVESIVKNEHTQGFDVRHSTNKCGTHTINMTFGGVEIAGSPCEYFVTRAEFCELETVLEQPHGVGAPHNMAVDEKYTIVAHLRDRFGNHVDKGGVNARARLVHVKQGLHDSTELNIDNHKVEVEDQRDGTYLIRLELMSEGGQLNHFPMIIELYLILDDDDDADFDPSRRKDNLPPMKLTFKQQTDLHSTLVKTKTSSDFSKKPDQLPIAKSSNEFSSAKSSKESRVSPRASTSSTKATPAQENATNSQGKKKAQSGNSRISSSLAAARMKR